MAGVAQIFKGETEEPSFHRGLQGGRLPSRHIGVLCIIVRTLFCIWLFSSALSAFDRGRLSTIEVILRFATAFALLAVSPAIHLLAIVSGIALIGWGLRRQ